MLPLAPGDLVEFVGRWRFYVGPFEPGKRNPEGFNIWYDGHHKALVLYCSRERVAWTIVDEDDAVKRQSIRKL